MGNAMKLAPCAEQQGCILLPACLSLQTCCMAPTYLLLVSGDGLKITSAAGLTNMGFALIHSSSAMQPMQQEASAGSSHS